MGRLIQDQNYPANQARQFFSVAGGLQRDHKPFFRERGLCFGVELVYSHTHLLTCQNFRIFCDVFMS